MQKGFALPLILIGILLVSLIGAGGYYFYQNKYFPKTSIPQPSPQPQKDETSDWKTYTNTKYGYSIKYPEEYMPYGLDKESKQITSSDAKSVMFSRELPPSTYNDPLPAALWIKVLDKGGYEAQRQKLDEAAGKAPCAGCPVKNKSKIGDYEATLYDGYGGYTIDKVWLLNYQDRYLYFSYSLDFGYDNKTPELMLATFKFLDDETANWKTYTNKEFHYSIKYPELVTVNGSKDYTDFIIEPVAKMNVGGGVSIRIKIIDNSKGITSMAQIHKDNLFGYECDTENGGKCENVILNGYNALKVTDFINIQDDLAFYIPKDKRVYIISTQKDKLLPNQIIATFKILE